MMAGGIGNCWYSVYVAVRFLVPREEYDERTDPRTRAAKKHKLDVWSVRPRGTAEDPDVDESQVVLLFGKKLALIGDGGADAARVPAKRLAELIKETRARLRRAGFDEEPEIWMHCDIDLGD